MNRESFLAGLGVFVLRLLFLTLRLRFEDRIGFTDGRYNKPVIMCFWHNRILGITFCFLRSYPHGKRPGVTVLTSRSKDGAILAGVANGLGMGATRGSSSRGGSQALLELSRLLEHNGDLAITPDGPRGPRYVLSPGPIFLAQSSGVVLAPVHASFSRCWRLKTWDEFIIPLPFSRVSVTVDHAIEVPRELTEEQFETMRARVETLLKNEAD